MATKRRSKLALGGAIIVFSTFALLLWGGVKSEDQKEPLTASSGEPEVAAWVLPRFEPVPIPVMDGESASTSSPVDLSALIVCVRDVTGGPVIGARIELNEVAVGTTDAEGRLSLHLEQRDFPYAGKAIVRSDGYSTTTGYYRGPGTVTFVMIPEGKISGRALLESSRKPASGIRILIGTGEAIETGLDGTFVFRGVEPGTYRVIGRAKGWFGALNSPVSIGPATTVSGLELLLFRAYSIRGKITEDGKPLPGATVVGADTSGTTDADGNYELQGVQPGSYEVGLGYDPRALFNLGTGSLAVTILDRDVTADLDIGARSIVTLEALDRLGRPQQNVRFNLRQKIGETEVDGGCVSGSDGRCVVRGVAQGLFLARIGSGGFRKVYVSADQSNLVQFSVPDAVNLTGKIVRADGGPVGSRFVIVENRDAGYSESMNTAPDGHFHFARVAPGNATVTVQATNSLSSFDAIEAQLNVAVPQWEGLPELLIEVPAEDQHIYGSVIDTEGQSAASVLIVCKRGRSLPGDTTVTDEKGLFHCSGLRRGYRYEIFAYSADGSSGSAVGIEVGTSDTRLRLKL